MDIAKIVTEFFVGTIGLGGSARTSASRTARRPIYTKQIAFTRISRANVSFALAVVAFPTDPFSLAEIRTHGPSLTDSIEWITRRFALRCPDISVAYEVGVTGHFVARFVEFGQRLW